jgi:RNA polymerase sigma-70 factor (ECF subfamily)
MTRATEPDTAELLERTGAGDRAARGALLQRHRERLRRLVALRMDRRLAARLDPSDLVQEVLAEAERRLDDYLRRRPLPFFPWLRQLAADRLADAHRRHVQAARRSIAREEHALAGLPPGSAEELAARLVGSGTGPSEAIRREELQRRVQAALAALSEPDREVLLLRHLEQLPAREVAAMLGLSEAAVKSRALRAMQRLRALLGNEHSRGGR